MVEEEVKQEEKPKEQSSETESFIKKLEELKEVDKSLGDKLKEFREIEASRLMGSSAGLRKEPEAAKQESSKDYADKVMGNKVQ